MNRRTFLKVLGAASATVMAPGVVTALIPQGEVYGRSQATAALPTVGHLTETIYHRIDLIGNPWQIYYVGQIAGEDCDLSILCDREPTEHELATYFRPMARLAMNRAIAREVNRK